MDANEEAFRMPWGAALLLILIGGGLINGCGRYLHGGLGLQYR